MSEPKYKPGDRLRHVAFGGELFVVFVKSTHCPAGVVFSYLCRTLVGKGGFSTSLIEFNDIEVELHVTAAEETKKGWQYFLEWLSVEKEHAVSDQDFHTASAIRDAADALKKVAKKDAAEHAATEEAT